MSWSRPGRRTIAGLAVVVLVAGGGALAAGAGPAPASKKIVGCYDKGNGDLRVVKKARQCRDDELVLRWNKRGPRGLRGAAGAPGADGAPGATILTGTGGPTADLGRDGDYYVDTRAAQLYGPKDGGAWPATGTSLRGPAGPQGSQGDPGPQGPQGDPGPPGPQGDPGSGHAYTASSQFPAAVTSVLGGLAGTGVVLPLSGAGSESVPTAGPTLDLTASGGGMVQVIPADTTITSFSARMSANVSVTLGLETVTLTAQLFTGSLGSTTLTPVPGATCDLAPALAGAVSIGQVSSCTTTGLSIPLSAGTTAVYVFTATSNPGALVSAISGFYSVSMGTG